MSGLSVALDKALKAAQSGSDEQSQTATVAKPATGTTATAAIKSPERSPNWEDAGKIEPGLAYEELVRRFGPPSMAVSNSTGKSLTYRGKDGMYQVEVRDAFVTAIDQPRR